MSGDRRRISSPRGIAHSLRARGFTRRIAVGAPLVVLAACGLDAPSHEIGEATAAVSATGVVVSMPISATNGGVLVHPGGARLSIPPGGLPADTVVSLTDEGYRAAGADPALRPASHHFVVSMPGLRSCNRATLSVEAREVSGAPVARDAVVVGAVDAAGELTLYRPDSLTAGAQGGLATSIDVCRRARVVPGTAALSFAAHASVVHGLDLVAQPTILRVPYYSQDNLPWCVPTSLAMVMNQFDNLEGIVSNYELAGADGQAADEGNAYTGILGSMGVDPTLYSYVKWDADLIPSAPFNNYVKTVLGGAFPQYTRGLGMSSTTTSHAFVGVGANNSHIWLHDASGAFAGDDDIAIKLTWAEFRATALDETSSTELRTLYIDRPLRPAAERTGSLVLAEGTGTSFTYETDAGVDLSRWQWDGALSSNGYFWDDVLGSLPADSEYGSRFPRTGSPARLPGRFAYRTSVANVTGTSRTYEVRISLETALGSPRESKVANIVVPPYSWKGHEVAGVLEDFVIGSEGEYRLDLELWEGGTQLDVKQARFRVSDLGFTLP
jgi:hypothetical protein